MQKEKWFLIMGLVVLLISLSLQSERFRDFRKSPEVAEGLEFNGYIVELKTPGVIEKKVELEKFNSRNVEAILSNQRSLIASEQETFREKVSELTNNGRLNGKVENVLNAVFLYNVDESELEILRNRPEVKRVVPNYALELFLNESVPLIGADEVWERDNKGDLCSGVALAPSITERVTAGVRDLEPADKIESEPGQIVCAQTSNSCSNLGLEGCFNNNEQICLDLDGNGCFEWVVQEQCDFGCADNAPFCATECITGNGVTIGIIDTGVDYTHPDLGGCTTEEFLAGECEKVVGGWDFVDGDGDPRDMGGHGTHVAAIAAGNGDWNGDGVLGENEGFYGVAKDATIFAYRTISEEDNLDGFIFKTMLALDRSVDPNQDGDLSDHLDIISLSAGFSCSPIWNYTDVCGPNDVFSTAINNLVQQGVVAVIAAGNSGTYLQTITIPGVAKDAITSSGSDKSDDLGGYSSGPVFGSEFGYIKPDIIAPGKEICAAIPYGYAAGDCHDEDHKFMSGSSMATPHVSSLSALILQLHPEWNPREVKHAIRNNAVDLGYGLNRQGYGRVHSFNSVFSNSPSIVEINTGGVVADQIEFTGTVLAEDLDYYQLSISRGVFRDVAEEVYNLGWEEAQTLLQDLSWEQTFRFIIGHEVFFPLKEEDWDSLWTLNQEIENGSIGFEDSNLLNNDIYYLRLKAYLTNGDISEDYSVIYVQNRICGNNIHEYGEPCDDGNLENGDGCSSVCEIE